MKTVDEFGRAVQPGDEVTSFRGEPGIFKYATRPRRVGKMGKVVIEKDGRVGEYYDSAFGLTVTSDE